jgi:transposase
MKKISTAAAQKVEKIEGQRLTIGLDLGDRWSWYCVLNGGGEVALGRKLATTPKAMKEVFGEMPRSRIALETGMHSPWVSRLLSELEYEVIVAHARNVRLIGESRRKNDRFDARTLARLARIDPELLGPVQHRSRKAQADLTVMGGIGPSPHVADQHRPRTDEIVWRAAARLQPAEGEPRTGRGAEPGITECLATVAG